MGNENRQEVVKFYGDKITTIQEPDGTIWVSINDVLRNIGFDEAKIKNQRLAWRKEYVVSKGAKILGALTNGGIQDIACLNLRYIPIAIAKIAITPTMQKEYPEMAEKLMRYQLECAEVLYKHFISRTDATAPVARSESFPLTREEAAAYYTFMTDLIKGYTDTLTKRDQEREKLLSDLVESQKKLIVSQTMFNNSIAGFVQAKNEPEKINRVNPLLINSISSAEKNEWISKAWNNARIIGERSGQDEKSIFRSIYKEIKKDGIDLDSLQEEYSLSHVKSSKINMCADSDFLRKRINKEFNMLAQKYYPEKFTAESVLRKTYLSQTVMVTPENVRVIIEKYASKHKRTYQCACYDVYRKMEKIGGFNMKKLVKDYGKTLGVNHCCNGYFIANNKAMLDLLKKAAED